VVLALILGLINFYYSYQAKKMLKEKLEQTENELVAATRPLLVARAVIHDYATTYAHHSISVPTGTPPINDNLPSAAHFSHFELYNAGNGPAIGLEISLMNEDKVVLQCENLGFLRNNEPALLFVPINLEAQKTYYLVSEYESVRSRGREIWYQTWLQFTTVECVAKDTINIIVGSLDFREVSLNELIDAFKTRAKAD
jgi:hypothetical protein